MLFLEKTVSLAQLTFLDKLRMTKATRDHFVPQAYLRAWGDSVHGDKLHIYRKRNDRHSIEQPKHVCVERQGDLNKYFADRAVLRRYLDYLEPNWPAARDLIVTENADGNAFFAAAGLIAYLLTCGPTTRRMSGEALESSLDAMRPAFARHIMADTKLRAGPAGLSGESLLDRNKIKIVVDPEYARAIHIQGLISTQYRLFSGQWNIVSSGSYKNFITSDNPVVKYVSGPSPTSVFLCIPVTPSWAILIRPSLARYPIEEVERIPEFGGAQFSDMKPDGVEMLNSLIAASAEDVIISAAKPKWFETLCLENRDFRMEAETSVLPAAQGHIQMLTQRPRNMKTGAAWKPPK